MGNFWGWFVLSFSGAKGGFLYTASCGCAVLQGLVIFELSGSMGMDKNGNDISQLESSTIGVKAEWSRSRSVE